jgi:hypothetical protein
MSRPPIISDPSLLPPPGAKGDPGPKGDAGQSIKGDKGDPGIVWRGNWRRGTYQPGEAIFHSESGGSYVCVRETRREPPHRDWSVLAAKGEPGKEGSTTVIRHGSPRIVQALARLDEIEAQLQGSTSQDLPTIQYGEAVTKGQPVYIAGDGRAFLAQADDVATSKVAGLAADNYSLNQIGSLCVDSVLDQSDWSAVTGSTSLIPGGQLYLSATTAGTLSFVPPSATGQYVVRVANALSTTAAEVEIAQSVLL